jgi:hypothetical protein
VLRWKLFGPSLAVDGAPDRDFRIVLVKYLPSRRPVVWYSDKLDGGRLEL